MMNSLSPAHNMFCGFTSRCKIPAFWCRNFKANHASYMIFAASLSPNLRLFICFHKSPPPTNGRVIHMSGGCVQKS